MLFVLFTFTVLIVIAAWFVSAKPVAAGGRGRYLLSQALDDYFVVPGREPDGKWFGSGLETLGLQDGGTVTNQAYKNFLLGRSPDGIRQLVTHQKYRNEPPNRTPRKARCAFHCDASAPKSVSVLILCGDDHTYREGWAAHRHADDEKNRFLAEECAWARSKRNGVVEIVPVKISGVSFEHCSARPVDDAIPDPDVHTHDQIFNMGERPDGTFAKLYGWLILKGAFSADMLYQAHLAAELTERLGVELYRPVKDGKKADHLEIVGVERELVDHFSKRRRLQIEPNLSDDYTAKEAGQVALGTRQEKSLEFSRFELVARWRSDAQAHGFDLGQVLDQARQYDRESVIAQCRQEASKTLQGREFSAFDYISEFAKAALDRGGLKAAALRRAVEQDLTQFKAVRHYRGQTFYECERAQELQQPAKPAEQAEAAASAPEPELEVPKAHETEIEKAGFLTRLLQFIVQVVTFLGRTLLSVLDHKKGENGMIKVYHSNEEKGQALDKPERESPGQAFELVAEVQTHDLDRAYALTNECGSEYANQVTLFKEGARCTSVGDILVMEDGRAFRCEPAGWSEVEFLPEKEAPSRATLGERVAVTVAPEAAEQLTQEEIGAAIGRHERGDWGDVGLPSQTINRGCIERGEGCVFSAYRTESGTEFIVERDLESGSITVATTQEYVERSPSSDSLPQRIEETRDPEPPVAGYVIIERRRANRGVVLTRHADLLDAYDTIDRLNGAYEHLNRLSSVPRLDIVKWTDPKAPTPGDNAHTTAYSAHRHEGVLSRLSERLRRLRQRLEPRQVADPERTRNDSFAR